MNALNNFIGKRQLKTMIELSKGSDDSKFFQEKMLELTALFNIMPKPYETNSQGKNAIIHLHYFSGGSDFYITERDSSDEQLQAFGLVCLNGERQYAEQGYISIQELIECGVELDLHWTPKTLQDIYNEWEFEK